MSDPLHVFVITRLQNEVAVILFYIVVAYDAFYCRLEEHFAFYALSYVDKVT